MSDVRHYSDSDAGDSWATPPEYWEPLADALGGFDLDPASGAEPDPIAPTRYTIADDGLSTPWFGDIWVNPPYGRQINEMWAERIAGQAQNPDVETITALVPASTGAAWYQDNYAEADYETFVRGRIGFIGEKDDDASFYSAIITFGDVPDDYLSALMELGEVRAIPEGKPVQTRLFADGGTTQ